MSHLSDSFAYFDWTVMIVMRHSAISVNQLMNKRPDLLFILFRHHFLCQPYLLMNQKKVNTTSMQESGSPSIREFDDANLEEETSTEGRQTNM